MIAFNITTSTNLLSIKERFTSAFPFLKLEFFKHKHETMGASAKKDLFESNIALKSLPKKYIRGSIRITEEMPVSELEKSFEEQFGLSVQVFRKSGRSWLETTRTDDWTLKHQNDEGKALSQFIRGW